MQKEEQVLTFLAHAKSTLPLESIPAPNGNIYFGSVQALASSVVGKLQIGAVLSILTDKEKRKCKLDKRIQELDDICKHMSLSLQEEDQTIAPYFYSAIDFVREALAFGYNVLLHCKTGNDRSPALAAAYLIAEFGLSAQQAVQKVTILRPTVKLSEYAVVQLKEEQQKLQNLKKNSNK